MNYQLTLAIKQRKCSTCTVFIAKGIQHFVMSDWPRNQDFPIKKNICMNCAPKLTDPEFISYLKALLKQLENLETLQQTVLPNTNELPIYICPSCQAQVKYDTIWERYKCQYINCAELYELEEVKSLNVYKG